VMDIQPSELHQRVPLFIGSKRDVDLATRTLAGHTELVGA
jgi:fructose-1,6-bisphosphatase